jgi:ATP-dependent RNA helicase DeaD
MTTFQDLNLPELVLAAITELGFVTPTPIQEKVIPVLLENNQDIIGLAQTGTGKTAAFGLPAIALTEIEDRFPQTLVLAPTRELCLQITEDLKKYSKHIEGMNIVPVYGGSSIELQIRSLQKGAHIVVATPGRAKDLIKQRKLHLNRIERVILDEADEMLSMGFQEDLDFILDETPTDKQTLLFSATMYDGIRKITKNYMHNPIEISVARANSGALNVNHVYYMTHAKDRYEALKRVVDMEPNIYGIIFCRTRQETNEVANKLMQEHYNADVLHGDLSQNMRDDVMNRFRTRQLQLLVATDVAARGLDVNDLTHVINYNLPDDYEVYTHRSGRTGRAGKTGTSVVIVHTRETRKIKDIEKFMGISFTQGEIATGEQVCQTQLYSLMEKIKSIEVNKKQIEPFLPGIYEMLEGLTREDLIQHFVSAEFNRFLTYYKDARDINVAHEGSHNVASRRGSSTFTRLFINIGKRDKLSPAKLIGLINEALDSKESEIGKIDLQNNFSFFEIQQDYVAPLMETLNGVPYGYITLSLEVSKVKSSSGGGDHGGRERRGGYGGGNRGDRSGGSSGRGGYGSRNSERSGGSLFGTDDRKRSDNTPRDDKKFFDKKGGKKSDRSRSSRSSDKPRGRK